MTPKQEAALRQAREALKESHPEAYRHTIAAIDEALAEQPAHVAAVNTSSERVDKTAKNVHEQPAQPSKPWVGLTEEEIKDCFKITPDQHLPWHIYQRIEAKLKERNA